MDTHAHTHTHGRYQTYYLPCYVVDKKLNKSCIHLPIADRTLPWQPIKFANRRFSWTNLYCRACHFKTDWNIEMPMGILQAHWIMYNFVEVRFNSSRKTCAHFLLVWKNRKNGHIQPIISERDRPILTKFSALIDMWMGIINPTFVLTLLWRDVAMATNEFFLGGGFLQTTKLTAFSLCLGVPKRNAVSPSPSGHQHQRWCSYVV